nr:hypothetical protein [Candidatus Sigynarchaeota archaeon]
FYVRERIFNNFKPEETRRVEEYLRLLDYMGKNITKEQIKAEIRSPGLLELLANNNMIKRIKSFSDFQLKSDKEIISLREGFGIDVADTNLQESFELAPRRTPDDERPRTH